LEIHSGICVQKKYQHRTWFNRVIEKIKRVQFLLPHKVEGKSKKHAAKIKLESYDSIILASYKEIPSTLSAGKHK